MLTVSFSDNWNGALLLDCFPVIRPANENLATDLEVEISIKGSFAGYAKIIQGQTVLWKSITEGMAHLIIGHNSIYLRTVLAKVFGFTGENKPHPEFPLFFGFAQWTQRHMPMHKTLFDKWYRKAGEKHTTLFSDQPLDYPEFAELQQGKAFQ